MSFVKFPAGEKTCRVFCLVFLSLGLAVAGLKIEVKPLKQ